MDARTLTALEGSIKKWEEIVAGTGEDFGSSNCPLCALFFDETDPELEDESQCFGCPVSAKVGETGCVNTPYMAWAKERPWLGNGSHKADTPLTVKLAQAERDFLRSLLPPC